MMKKLFSSSVCAAMVALAALPVLADGTTTDKDQIARLESMLNQQAARLEQLQEQLVASSGQDDDTARVEAMKQQIREVLSEQEFRESLMPSMMQAGYDKGFFIKSSDDKFKMKFNGRLMFRWTHYATQRSNRYLTPRLQRNDRTGFDMQELRLTFSGHAYTPDLTYEFQIEGDQNGANFAPEEAWVDYRFSDAFHVQAGLLKLASLRQSMTSSSALQFCHRTMAENVFTFDRGIGVRFWGRLFDKRVDWYIEAVNSFNGVGNRTITNDQASPTGTSMDSNPALLFHIVWHALGEKPGDDLKCEGDIEKLSYPALDLGFHYGFNEDEGDTATTRLPFPLPRRPLGVGGYGLTNTNGMQINQFGFEAAFKYMGFSATSEYVFRILDPRRAGRRPFTPWWMLTRQGDTVTMHGAYLQLGYMLPIPGLENKLEAVARAGGISVLGNGQEGTWEYGAGLNYYLEGHKVKLQTDVVKIYEVPITSSSGSVANVNDDALVWRVQLQVSF